METHEPLFGEYIKIVANYRDDFEDLVYAKFAVIVPGLTRDEVASLPGPDGVALMLEVSRIWEAQGTPPLKPNNGGPPSSTDSSPENLIEKLPSV